MKRRLFLALTAVAWFCAASPKELSAFTRYSLQPGRTLYGSVILDRPQNGETLQDIAARNGISSDKLRKANPGIDPQSPGKAPIIVPQAVIIPEDHPAEGILLDTAEMRLYLFEEGAFFTAPLETIGGTTSIPVGIYTIQEKLRERYETNESPGQGRSRPLETGFVIRLSKSDHGLCSRDARGRLPRGCGNGSLAVGHQDMSRMFGMVKEGTLVQVTAEPVKTGWDERGCWLMVSGAEGRTDPQPGLIKILDLVSRCREKLGPIKLDLERIKRTLREKRGIPELIGVRANGRTPAQ